MFKNSAIGMPMSKYIQNLGMVFGLMAIGMPVDKGMAVGRMAIGMPAGKYIKNLGNRHGSWPRNIFKTSAWYLA
jgi:hypothetical protein